MAKSKLKKKKKKTTTLIQDQQGDKIEIPIPNLPEKYFCMKVKSGTKLRNVLDYSLKHFSGHDNVVWCGVGRAIGKVISCVEILKRKFPGLHQITKLRYVKSKSSEEELTNQGVTTNRMVPEIHILLSKDLLDTKEPGYQASGICRMFQDCNNSEADGETSRDSRQKVRISSVTAQEFASMGLRTGQKRPRQNISSEKLPKKTKKSDNGD